jgi:hypothetical protein
MTRIHGATRNAQIKKAATICIRRTGVFSDMPCAANEAPAPVFIAPFSNEKLYPEAKHNNGKSNTHVIAIA